MIEMNRIYLTHVHRNAGLLVIGQSLNRSKSMDNWASHHLLLDHATFRTHVKSNRCYV